MPHFLLNYCYFDSIIIRNFLMPIIFIFSLCNFMLTQGNIQAKLHYPAWFWKMPIDSVIIFAVGYAKSYHRSENSYAEARKNCIWQLIRSLQLNIQASQELNNQFGQNKLLGVEENESIDSTIATTIGRNFYVVDSAIVGDMVISLAAFPGNMNSIQVVKTQTLPSKRPYWIDNIPQEENFIYSVGTSTLFYYENHSWEKAEANARLQIAYTIASRIQSATRKEQGTIQIWSKSKTAIELRNAKIVERWLDYKNRQCYVLCCMSLK